MPGIATPQFQPLRTSDFNLTKVQQNIAATFNALTSNPLVTGQLVQVTFADSDTDVVVNHGLGSSNVTFLSGGQTAAGSLYISPNDGIPGSNPTPDSTLLLRATAPMTAYIYVFRTS